MVSQSVLSGIKTDTAEPATEMCAGCGPAPGRWPAEAHGDDFFLLGPRTDIAG